MELTPFTVQAGRACPDARRSRARARRRVPPAGPGATGDGLDDLAPPRSRVRDEDRRATSSPGAPRPSPRASRRATSSGRGSTTCCSTASSRTAPAIRSRSRSVCVEAARRAGIGLGIVAGGAGCYVGHPLLDEPLLVDVAQRRAGHRGRRPTPTTPAWQCSHQVAARMLNRIGERAEHTGNVAWALRAAELRLALPFARPVLDELATRWRTCARG